MVALSQRGCVCATENRNTTTTTTTSAAAAAQRPRRDQTDALMKEMFSNVPDKTPAVAPANEYSEGGFGETRFSPQVRNFLWRMSQRAFFLKGGVHISVYRLRDGRVQGAEN